MGFIKGSLANLHHWFGFLSTQRGTPMPLTFFQCAKSFVQTFTGIASEDFNDFVLQHLEVRKRRHDVRVEGVGCRLNSWESTEPNLWSPKIVITPNFIWIIWRVHMEGYRSFHDYTLQNSNYSICETRFIWRFIDPSMPVLERCRHWKVLNQVGLARLKYLKGGNTEISSRPRNLLSLVQ